jgi:hypothetical protein
MTPEELEHQNNIERALATCRSRLREKPANLPLQIAEEQLSRLSAWLSGDKFDTKEFSEINVGVLAVREFEPNDMELADQIYKALEVKQYLAKLATS